MRSSKLVLSVAAAMGVFMVTSLPAAQPSTQEQRVRAFAALPDWRGMWEAEAWTQRTAAGRPAGGMDEVRARAQLMGHPPYNPEWEKRYQEGMKTADAVRASEQGRKSCNFGFPIAMESPSVFQIVLTPEEVLFVFVTQDVRHVYTDGRPHAPEDERWPTRMGDAIGHWEGQTLVIETIARLPTEALAPASPFSKVSDKAKFTERIRLLSRDVLEDEMTIDDPVTLARPWTVKIHYRRVMGLERMTNYDCTENDRNPVINGKLTVAPP